MLSVGTLLALPKRMARSPTMVARRSWARLKAIDAETSVRSQAAWGVAVDLLEQLQARLARDRSRRQLDYLNY